MRFPSVNSRLPWQIPLKGCPRDQNCCQLHYHAANTVLTCEWTIKSQQIWRNIFIMHAILGKNRGLGIGGCIYTYAGETPSVSELSSSSDGTGGIPALVAPAVVKVHPCLCASIVSVDIFLCDCGTEGSHPFDFRAPLPGVFWLHAVPCYNWETKDPAAFHLGLLREVSW